MKTLIGIGGKSNLQVTNPGENVTSISQMLP